MDSLNINCSHLSPVSPTFLKEARQYSEILLDRLDDMAEELRRQEKPQKPIPSFLFHATPAFFVPNILQEGLIASKLPGEKNPVVCMSDSEEFAFFVASLTQQKMGRIALFEVDTAYLTPSRIRNYLSNADDVLGTPPIREVRYVGDVPSYALTLK
jgi:hypothetical protein